MNKRWKYANHIFIGRIEKITGRPFSELSREEVNAIWPHVWAEASREERRAVRKALAGVPGVNLPRL